MKKQQLYVKNEKGRYEPYKEPECDNALYRRKGKRYEPIAMYFESGNYWQEGVFAVIKNSSSTEWASADYLRTVFKLYKCGDIEQVPVAKLAGMKKLSSYLVSHWDEIDMRNVHEASETIVALIMNFVDEKEE